MVGKGTPTQEPGGIGVRAYVLGRWERLTSVLLGFGVPYFNTFFLKGTLMKYKFILFFSLVT